MRLDGSCSGRGEALRCAEREVDQCVCVDHTKEEGESIDRGFEEVDFDEVIWCEFVECPEIGYKGAWKEKVCKPC